MQFVFNAWAGALLRMPSPVSPALAVHLWIQVLLQISGSPYPLIMWEKGAAQQRGFPGPNLALCGICLFINDSILYYLLKLSNFCIAFGHVQSAASFNGDSKILNQVLPLRELTDESVAANVVRRLLEVDIILSSFGLFICFLFWFFFFIAF